MIKKITQIAAVIMLVLLLVSCQNTKQKMQGYVNSYNHSAANFTNEVITSTSAKAFLDKNKIEIRLETNLEQNEDNKSIYNQMLPGIFAEMLKKEDQSMELIEEGVIFDVYFLAEDYTVLTELKVDKKELKKMLKDKVAPTATENAAISNSNLSPEMQEMLVMMNRNMPIKNADGSKILKIEINEKGELLYKIEIPNEFAELLKGESAKAVLKEEILRNNNLKNVVNVVKRFGIKTIIYEYLDVKGKMINNVVLIEKDLR